MAEEESKVEVAMVHAIEGAETTADSRHAVFRLALSQGTVPVAFTAAQLPELLLLVSRCLGETQVDQSVTWTAENWRIARTYDGRLRLDFRLPGPATISLAIPMSEAPLLLDQVRAVMDSTDETLAPGAQRH
jgi:hypothetical protein